MSAQTSARLTWDYTPDGAYTYSATNSIHIAARREAE